MPLIVLDAIAVIGVATEILVWSMMGWRYILSPKFRQAAHAQWQTQRKIMTFVHIFMALVGIVITTVLTVALVEWIILSVKGHS